MEKAIRYRDLASDNAADKSGHNPFMRLPILTYHSAYINGDSYTENDHLAFHDDLRLVHRLGLRVISLESLAARLGTGACDLKGYVAFSMDDGTNFDFYDLPHPIWGVQRSMLNILKDFVNEFGSSAQPELHATSFVIASPDARGELDRTCLINRGWYTDEWWAEAIASELMGIANHSWDHNHLSLETVAQRDQEKGSFMNIDQYVDADVQIRQAADFLAEKTAGRASPLFAYPFGEINEYLSNTYLPDFIHEHRMVAAFGTQQRSVARPNGMWTLPRLVFRDDWHTPEQLAGLLASFQREQ